MNRTEIKIETLKGDMHTLINAQEVQNAIFVENAHHMHVLSKITLAGQYCREYTIVSDILELNPARVLLDGKLLLVLLWAELAIIDVEQDKLLRVIKFDSWELFGIYKFKSGYFIHGEDATRFLNDKFEQIWEGHCVDIFANYKIGLGDEVRIYDDYWTIIDWYGYNHYYDEKGEFKIEYCPQYDSENKDK